MKPQIKTAILSYLRAAAASVLALGLSGIVDPPVLANAFLAALLGPLLRALDPKDAAIGWLKK